MATRSNGIFASEQMDNFMTESGMGLPECGTSPWAAMLKVTPDGDSRGFSYAKRGMVFRYVEEDELAAAATAAPGAENGRGTGARWARGWAAGR